MIEFIDYLKETADPKVKKIEVSHHGVSGAAVQFHFENGKKVLNHFDTVEKAQQHAHNISKRSGVEVHDMTEGVLEEGPTEHEHIKRVMDTIKPEKRKLARKAYMHQKNVKKLPHAASLQAMRMYAEDVEQFDMLVEAKWENIPDKPATDLKRGDKVLVRQGAKTIGATYLQTQSGNGKPGHPNGHLVKYSDAHVKAHGLMTGLKWHKPEEVFRSMDDYAKSQPVKECQELDEARDYHKPQLKAAWGGRGDHKDLASAHKKIREKEEAKKMAEYNAEQKKKRAAARMAELDAMPDLTPEQQKKADSQLASLLKNRNKYKDVMGS